MTNVPDASDAKARFLVLHDYGMGGLWWWVRARSAEQIVETIAEVEVVTDTSVASSWDDVEEVDVDAVPPGPLADLRDARTAHRSHPAYGHLAGRERVYLREQDPDDGSVFLLELGPDGRRLRQVQLCPDGDHLRTDDWPFNPPFDLRDPQYAEAEISAEVFEQAWRSARPDPEDW